MIETQSALEITIEIDRRKRVVMDVNLGHFELISAFTCYFDQSKNREQLKEF